MDFQEARNLRYLLKSQETHLPVVLCESSPWSMDYQMPHFPFQQVLEFDAWLCFFFK